jgi:hypothetical protein
MISNQVNAKVFTNGTNGAFILISFHKRSMLKYKKIGYNESVPLQNTTLSSAIMFNRGGKQCPYI